MAQGTTPPYQTFATQVPRTTTAGERVDTGSVLSSKPPILTIGTVAALGSTQANAGLVPIAPVVTVTAADATKGVVLPTVPVGTLIWIHNVANATLKVYPPTGGDVNDGSANAAITMAAKSQGRFIKIDGVTWSASYV